MECVKVFHGAQTEMRKIFRGTQTGMRKIFCGTQTGMRKIFPGTQNVHFHSSGTQTGFSLNGSTIMSIVLASFPRFGHVLLICTHEINDPSSTP